MNDVTRFAHFSEFRNGIRGSRTHLIVGIDIAKDKHHAFFGTAYGQALWRRLIFTKDLIGYNRLMEQVRVVSSQNQLEQVVFGMEPTSNYHIWGSPIKGLVKRKNTPTLKKIHFLIDS